MAFKPGYPALTKPRAVELRQVQDRFDVVRQRLLNIDTELTRLASVADSSSLAVSVQNLQSSVRSLLLRVSALEAALGITDTLTLAAGEVVNAYDCIVPVGTSSCGPADPNDPTHIHALLGVAQAAAAVGATVTIQRRGSITIPGAAFTTGRPCYVGLDAQITQDSSYSAYAVPVGVATSSTTVWIAPSLALLNQVDTYTSGYDGQLPVTYDYLRSQIGTLESLLNLTDGYVYLYQGTLVTVPGGGGGGGAVDSVNGQTGTVVLALDDLSDVSTAGALNGQILRRIAGLWTAVDFALDDLADVNVSGAMDGYVLTRRSGSWVAEAAAAGGVTSVNSQTGAVSLYMDTLLDVITFGAIEGDIIVRRSGSWVNESNPGQFVAASSAPANPQPGQRWVDLDTGIQYTYFYDGNGYQWVEF